MRKWPIRPCKEAPSAAEDAGAGAGGAREELPRGAVRLSGRDGAARGRSAASSARSPVPRGLPGERQNPGVHPAHPRGRFHRRRAHDQGGQRAPGRLRPRLPAGGPVREVLRPGEEGRAGGHRPAGAVRGRLRTRRTGRGSSRPSRRRTARRVAIVGAGPAGPDLRRRPRPARIPRDDLRGVPQSRRRAGLRHPGVPPAEGRSCRRRWTR